MRIALVAGARPNFVKIAPLRLALSDREGLEALVVHTGQHYDRAMSATFFEALNIPLEHPARDPLDNFYLATAQVVTGQAPTGGNWMHWYKRPAAIWTSPWGQAYSRT